MTGIRCPKCGEKEQRPWPINRSQWMDHAHVKVCPRGHEVPLFSKRAFELASALSSCSY